MDPDQRIHLQKLIEANGTEDHTEVIRRVKHSSQIHQDVTTMIQLKRDYGRLAKSNPKQFDAICVSRCAFLFTYYTDLYNRLKSGEIDLNLLIQMIRILREIEEAAKIGMLQSAEHAAKEKRVATKAAKTSRPAIPEKKLTWAEFKAAQAAADASTHPSPDS